MDSRCSSGLRLAFTPLFTALTAAFLILMSYPAFAGDTQADLKALMARLREIRTAIRSLELSVETVSRTERPGQSASEIQEVRRALYDRKLGKVRWDLVQPVIDTDGRKAKGVRVAAQSVPPPDWLYGLPERLAGADVTIRAMGGGSVVTVWAKGSMRETLGPLQEIEFDRDRLPVRQTTFGADRQPQDEIRIAWSRRGATCFPETATFVYPGQRNSLRRIDHYTVVRMNAAIAASLFVP